MPETPRIPERRPPAVTRTYSVWGLAYGSRDPWHVRRVRTEATARRLARETHGAETRAYVVREDWRQDSYGRVLDPECKTVYWAYWGRPEED